MIYGPLVHLYSFVFASFCRLLKDSKSTSCRTRIDSIVTSGVLSFDCEDRVGKRLGGCLYVQVKFRNHENAMIHWDHAKLGSGYGVYNRDR